jgi:pyruvate/2-oxoglutarate dehydrogenase complex dihydrolipoamide acyltransferase (E2) component
MMLRPRDVQFSGALDVDAGNLLAYLEHLREHDGVPATMTHLVGRAAVHAIQAVPALRRTVARADEQGRIDLLLIDPSPERSDLGRVLVHHAEAKTVASIAEELVRRAEVTAPVTKRRLALRPPAFSGAMIAAGSRYGIATAHAPLAAYLRVPILVQVGAVEQRPVARAGMVVIRPMVALTVTFDHRYVDGLAAEAFVDALRSYCSETVALELASLA